MHYECFSEINHPLVHSIQCGPVSRRVSGQSRVGSIKLFAELLEALHSSGFALKKAADLHLDVDCDTL